MPENLKNCLLVMADAGVLVPPEDREAGAGGKGDGDVGIWEETRVRIERFLPGLFGSVFPDAEATKNEDGKKGVAEGKEKEKGKN